jgi:hypothetical protein
MWQGRRGVRTPFRPILIALAFWTLLVAFVWLFTPSLMTAPPCTDPNLGPGCGTLNAAANDLVWRTQQRPMALLSVGGYLVIAIVAFVGRSRR